MQAAGVRGFEREQRKSNAEHLSVLEYKSEKEPQKALLLQKKRCGGGQVQQARQDDQILFLINLSLAAASR